MAHFYLGTIDCLLGKRDEAAKHLARLKVLDQASADALEDIMRRLDS